MKRGATLIAFLLGVCAYQAQVMWQFKKDTVITWNYTEGDEFNDYTINLEYWKYIGSSRSLFANKEQQYYTDGENHSMRGGSLKLTAKKDSVFNRTIDWLGDNDSLRSGKKYYGPNKRQFKYTAGKLISQKPFNKGFFECRFKIPQQKGYWPAFWLYGGSPNEEIDIMECKTEKPDQIHLDTHCGNHCDYVRLPFQKKSYGGWAKTKYNFVEGFNVVGCHWDDKEIRFYLNGECVGISKVQFDIEKNLAINIAVPSDDGPFKPGPSQNDTSVAVFEVDYIRIWEKNSAPEKAVINRIPANTFIDTIKPLATSPKSRARGKLTYGRKADHKDDGVFISYFQSPGFMQIYALGDFKDSKPTYTIKELSGKEVLHGVLNSQIFTIATNKLEPGNYELSIEWAGKVAKSPFVL